MRNPYMKFQNSSMHGSNVVLCSMHQKARPMLQRAITHDIFFRIYSKVNQVFYSSIPIHSPNFKALALIVFEIFCWKDFIHIFQRAITQKWGIILMGEICVSFFSWGIHIWNFKTRACRFRSYAKHQKACNVKMPCYKGP